MNIKKFLKNPNRIFYALGINGYIPFFSDETYLKLMYRCVFGKKLNLENPQTFNEKLQWLKLHNRRPEYTQWVDKYEVKKYISDVLGEEYVIPTLGVWDSFDDIDFDKLPNQFVLKCTHDSGGLVVCKDKTKLNLKEARKKITGCLKKSYYKAGREWPYKNVKPRIIAEEYLVDKTGNLQDYKVMNYNGIPQQILVCRDRFLESGLTEDFFDTNWKHLSIQRPEHSNSKEKIEKPVNLQRMIELASILSNNIPFLRTDFYEVNDELYFGELTFYPASGFSGFIPEEWDIKLGKLVKIGGGYLIINNGFALFAHMENEENTGINDYKFFCFNGKPKLFKIDFDRFTNHRANYYECTHNSLLPFGEVLCPPKTDKSVKMPQNLNLMKKLACILSQNMCFLRVDFYEVNNKVYFGEITFYPASGFGKFSPDEWDYKLGEWINIVE